MKKAITMNKKVLSGGGWIDGGTVKFYRVSRWIAVKQNYNPNKNNLLWDYVTDESGYKPYQKDFSPENGLYLDYFRWAGRNWAIEQFWILGNPFYMPIMYSYIDENGKTCFLSSVDSENYYNPIYLETDEYCERVRVYVEA